MSRQSTALLTVGPRFTFPWGDDAKAWRVSGSAQLVEGSTPYWIVTPTQPASHNVSPNAVEVVIPHPELVVDSILMLLAAHFGDNNVEAHLEETHNITMRDGVRVIAPYFELSEATAFFLGERLSQSMRLGMTLLDDMSLVDESVISSLRKLGFPVQVFAPISGPAS